MISREALAAALKKPRNKHSRRLIRITKKTQMALKKHAVDLSKQLGFKVYPMQVAAAVLELLS